MKHDTGAGSVPTQMAEMNTAAAEMAGSLIRELSDKVTELEIQLALQDDLLDSLNLTVAKMRDMLQLQQQELRYLHNRLPEKSDSRQVFEVPPHY